MIHDRPGGTDPTQQPKNSRPGKSLATGIGWAGAIVIVALLSAGLVSWKLVSIAWLNGAGTAHRTRPNLMIVTLDACRADHLSAYGYHRATSPALAALAEDGFTFTEAFTAATFSAPAHATILTGLYPFQHGLIDNGLELSEQVMPLADMLNRYGYDTAAFVAFWALGRESGLDKGFTEFQLHRIYSHEHLDKSLEREARGFRAAGRWLREWHAAETVSQEDPAARQKHKPFFMWFHAQQMHASYDPAPPYDTMFLDVPTTHQVPEVEDFNIRCNTDIVEAWDRGLLSDDMQRQVLALYDGEIRFVDDQLSSIFDYLKSIDVYDNTVIVVLADHGELFFEESEVDFDRAPPAHGAIYFDPCLRIPLILKPPAAADFAVGKQVTTLATAADVVPTVLDLVNLQAPEWLAGRSLVPWMREPKTVDHDDVTYFHEAPEGRQVCVGLRTPEWKFIRRRKISDVTKWRIAPDGNPEPRRKNNHEEEQAVTRWLFDLVNDPAERRNVFETEPVVARDLEARLDAWLLELDKATPSSYEDMSEQMLEALREAGYIRDE